MTAEELRTNLTPQIVRKYVMEAQEWLDAHRSEDPFWHLAYRFTQRMSQAADALEASERRRQEADERSVHYRDCWADLKKRLAAGREAWLTSGEQITFNPKNAEYWERQSVDVKRVLIVPAAETPKQHSNQDEGGIPVYTEPPCPCCDPVVPSPPRGTDQLHCWSPGDEK